MTVTYLWSLAPRSQDRSVGFSRDSQADSLQIRLSGSEETQLYPGASWRNGLCFTWVPACSCRWCLGTERAPMAPVRAAWAPASSLLVLLMPAALRGYRCPGDPKVLPKWGSRGHTSPSSSKFLILGLTLVLYSLTHLWSYILTLGLYPLNQCSPQTNTALREWTGGGITACGNSRSLCKIALIILSWS